MAKVIATILAVSTTCQPWGGEDAHEIPAYCLGVVWGCGDATPHASAILLWEVSFCNTSRPGLTQNRYKKKPENETDKKTKF